MTTRTFRASETYEQALDRAAHLWGVEQEYSDTWGRRHETSPEINRAILEALGVGAGSREDLDRAMEERLWSEWNRLLPPTLVLGEDARSFPVHLPVALAESRAEIEIQWEDGAVERCTLSLSELPHSGRAELRGATFICKDAPLRPGAPQGYHQVRIVLEGREAAMRLILCPNRVYVPPAIRDGRKTAGLAVALYGLRSQRNWGCGDFTDLKNLAGWVATEIGGAFIGLNPLHAIPNRQPFNISPYLPSSTFFKNPIYLDVEQVEDFRNSPASGQFSSPETQAEIERLRAAEFVEYERVYALKMRALALAFREFERASDRDPARAAAFRQFIESEGELLGRFAAWCALDESIHARQPDVWVWPDWPEDLRDPDSPAVRAFCQEHERAIRFHMYVQWQLDLQLEAVQVYARERGLAIGVYHDLALATDRCGADLWAHRTFYVAGCRVGAPPDGFSPKGQDWSFPPPNSDHHRETGYRLFTESIRANCRHGGALRIDHVMRFFRLYWIPEGMDPTQGAYVRDRADDLLHILALESVREKVAVIGEDLGTVTPEIRRALDRFGLFGYKVLYFEKNDRNEFRPPWEYPQQSMVSATTHDLPTLAGFWLARDIEARHSAGLFHDEASYRSQLADRAREKQKLLDALFAAGLLPQWFPRSAEQTPELTGELHHALVGWLASAPSLLLALNQEDLTKEPDQQNLPASTSEYPNWRRKMRFSLEELRSDQTARSFSAMFRHWLERTGRITTPVAAS